MGFEEGAISRFSRYRREADEYLKVLSETSEVADRFRQRLFDGIEYAARLAGRAGFDTDVEKGERGLRLHLSSGEGASSGVTFARIEGTAAETDEYLMHESLSRHTLEPSGYSGRILGWVDGVGPPSQTFAVYRDGTWRTTGMLVEKSRGKVEDPDDVMNGFCLRIVSRMVDLASPTSGSGRVWNTVGYSLLHYKDGGLLPVRTRWLK